MTYVGCRHRTRPRSSAGVIERMFERVPPLPWTRSGHPDQSPASKGTKGKQVEAKEEEGGRRKGEVRGGEEEAVGPSRQRVRPLLPAPQLHH